MKIGYICVKNLITSGGVEKYTWEMSKRLAARGHDLYIFSTDKVIPESIEGIHIIRVKSFGGSLLEKITGAGFATFKALTLGMDIYHFQAFGAGTFAFIPRLLGKVTIAQGHGIEWKRSKWGIIGKTVLRVTEYLSVKLCGNVMAVSRTQADDIRSRYNRQVAIVSGGIIPPDPVDAGEIRTRFGLEGKDYFLFVARLVPEKGAHYLIKAYKQLDEHRLKLVIVGEGDKDSEYVLSLRRLAEGSGDIIFTGFQSGKTLHELFSNAFAYVLPSELEGLSLSLLEAMSYGLCSIVSDIPENIEALGVPSNGVTFRNKEVDDLMEKLRQIQNSETQAAFIGEKAKHHVSQNYSWDTLSEQMESFYQKIARC